MDHLIFHEHFDVGPGRSPAWSESSLEASRPASHAPYTNRHVFLNIYNPANQTKKELIDNFVVRIKEFNEILEAVKHNEWLSPPRHFIVQGQRGSGKTTLLLRLYYELKELQPQNNWLITVRFDEEQYNIRTLYKLWENIAIYLEDELLEGFSGIYDEMQLHIEDRDYERICFDILKRNLQKTGKKLILLIDNFGDMLGKFDRREHQRLESILLKENCLRIIGGSSVIVDYKHDYTLPLYELLRIIQLEGLSQDETTELLLNLGKNYETNSINEIIRDDPGRVEALRRVRSFCSMKFLLTTNPVIHSVIWKRSLTV